jgi:hypothetical protein
MPTLYVLLEERQFINEENLFKMLLSFCRNQVDIFLINFL